MTELVSRPGLVHVEVLRGARADAGARPDLLVEVPHGADEAAHYAAFRARLRGDLPEGLEEFFWTNTDVGAWAYGRRTAERVLLAAPTRTALLVRCLIPRTFIDCNRAETFGGDADVGSGGLTAAIPSYVHDEADRALLIGAHREYVATARAAYALVCGGGGVAFSPHTYGPRSLGIERVDDDIVRNLRWATEAEREPTWPLRPEVDLVTRDDAGRELCRPGLEDVLLAAFRRAGFDPRANETYHMTAAALGYQWSVAYPGRVVCLEVRRDLLVDAWRWGRAMHVDPERIARVSDVLAGVLAGVLSE